VVDNSECDIIVVGDIRIRMYDDIVRTLTGVEEEPDFLKYLDLVDCRYISECVILKII